MSHRLLVRLLLIKIKKINVGILLFLFLSKISFAQKQDVNWCFGDSCGLNFNGSPTSFTSGINSIEASATISDNNGNLLFYAGSNDDGSLSSFFSITIWDSSHNVMQNGDSIEGSETVSQGCLFLPFVSDTNKYYLFTITCPQGTYLEHKLCYSVIDKSLNGGLGSVIQKNIVVSDSLITEQMRAVRHGNGRDWWLITHKYGNSDFYKYLISPTGITGPFVQTIGLPIDTGTVDLGQMDISNQGDKIAFACISGILELFDFDRCTGNLSNNITIGEYPDNQTYGYYGCAFSPDGNLLYTSRADTLFQFDLNAPNLKASRIKIYQTPFAGFGIYFIWQLQLAPDSNIYVSLNTPNNDSLNAFISVINNPNILGTGCGFVPFSVPLNSTFSSPSRLLTGLPNMPNYNLQKLEGSICDSLTYLTNFENDIKINLNPNPNDGNLCISYSHLGESKIEIFNILGNQVYKSLFLSGNVEQKLNLSSFTSGVYYVKINTGAFSKMVKFVKR